MLRLSPCLQCNHTSHRPRHARDRQRPLYESAQDWETPQFLFDGLNAEFGFDRDVCATAQNAKCRAFFTPDDNALTQRWDGVCWMNPPYGREIERWMRKAFESAQQGATVVCLVPARTDTRWWHRYAMRGEIRYLRGRLKFGHSDNSCAISQRGCHFPTAETGQSPI